MVTIIITIITLLIEDGQGEPLRQVYRWIVLYVSIAVERGNANRSFNNTTASGPRYTRLKCSPVATYSLAPSLVSNPQYRK